MKKLNLGCGGNLFNGWINIDLNTVKERNERLHLSEPQNEIDIQCNLLDGLPFNKNSVDFIYNEHVLEHFTFDEGEFLLKDWCSVLKKDGVLRIAIPSIEETIKSYQTGEGKRIFQAQKTGIKVRTNAEFFNVVFRNFGHKFIYDYNTLKMLLIRAGFTKISKQKIGISKYSVLNNLEHRIKGENSSIESLCVEAIK